jgi:hypothetical protein
LHYLTWMQIGDCLSKIGLNIIQHQTFHFKIAVWRCIKSLLVIFNHSKKTKTILAIHE